MNRRTLLATAASATALALGAGWYLGRTGSPSDALLGSDLAQDATVDTSTIVEMVEGNPDAAVEVIEYASFTCPHCASFHANQYQQLKANYIDTGKIRFVYREIYFDRPGLWASMVARCGGPLRFFGIADMFYTQQSEWTAGGDPATIAQNLRSIGKIAGLDDPTLDACMNDADTAQSLVAWFEENSTRDEITSTPSFLINGVKYSNMSYEDFAAILETELAK